jgi:acetyl-CoA carboxylase carboxyltransferase component
MSWKPEIDELREREKLGRAMGGPEKIKRQHDGGKLTVRERVEGLLDTGSFHEIGTLAGPWRAKGGERRTRGIRRRRKQTPW